TTDIMPSMNASSTIWAFTVAPPAPPPAVSMRVNSGSRARSAFAGIQPSLLNGDTESPIKHLIVLLGENRSFDHVFGTFQPDSGQTIFNLLSQGIVNADGSPGPNFARARQWEASATGAFSIHPPKTAPYAQLPAVTVADTPAKAPFVTAAAARS